MGLSRRYGIGSIVIKGVINMDNRENLNKFCNGDDLKSIYGYNIGDMAWYTNTKSVYPKCDACGGEGYITVDDNDFKCVKCNGNKTFRTHITTCHCAPIRQIILSRYKSWDNDDVCEEIKLSVGESGQYFTHKRFFNSFEELIKIYPNAIRE